MVRRLISAIAVVACAGSYALAATERATFILTDGERKSGPVVFHTESRDNLIAGNLNLGAADGKTEMTFPWDQVAVIDFVGGQPPVAELAQLGSGQMLAMRDGSTEPGRLMNMTGGDTVVWQNQAGQTEQFLIREVSRIYLNPQSARTVFSYTGATHVVGTTGTIGPGVTVRVDANQAWTDTGLTVNQGDRVAFNASGQIQFGNNTTQSATPDGNPAERRAAYPDPTVPVGALLGKIGNSAPFAIGMQTQPLVMPASGRLLLGINDNEINDNSGFFSVVVAKQ
jgi:hypothetical protein